MVVLVFVTCTGVIIAAAESSSGVWALAAFACPSRCHSCVCCNCSFPMEGSSTLYAVRSSIDYAVCLARVAILVLVYIIQREKG